MSHGSRFLPGETHVGRTSQESISFFRGPLSVLENLKILHCSSTGHRSKVGIACHDLIVSCRLRRGVSTVPALQDRFPLSYPRTSDGKGCWKNCGDSRKIW